MKPQIFILCIILFLFIACNKNKTNSNFKGTKEEIAYQKTFPLIQKTLAKHQINKDQFDILIQAFKDEEILELYAKNKTSKKYTLIREYSFCKPSGTLGPKRKEGDLQTPEGLYHINVINPRSTYHLSLGINYPNESDKILGDAKQPGSDIYIHGKCVTVGCIPLTDEKIEEVFTIARIASQQGQKNIPVYIFPFKMEKNLLELKAIEFPQFKIFWQQLSPFYQLFKREKKEIRFIINAEGEYILKQ